MRRAIRQTRQLTDRPFGVNLILQWPQQERLKVCLEEGVRVVSFFWGDPSPYIAAVHVAGSLVMHTVGSAAEARQVRDSGVDILVAQGWEAGGHVWGQVATLPLIPCVVDAVAPAPVVAAGGIADGRGLAAVLNLGAAGAWIGTRFIASQEADAHPVYKEKVLQAAETDTVYSRLFDGGWPDAPHRTLHNSTLTNWETSGSPPSGEPGDDGRGRGIGTLCWAKRRSGLTPPISTRHRQRVGGRSRPNITALCPAASEGQRLLTISPLKFALIGRPLWHDEQDHRHRSQ